MSTQAHELPDTGRLEIDDAKERLRQVLRQYRRKRHRHPARGHDAVCESLTTHALEAVKGMDRVAAYVSVGHEPCTRLLLERLTERGVRVLLPVLGPHLSRSWAYYRGAADLAERAPGRPPEPSGRVLPPEEIGRVDALLIPALAVDRGGRRLGQGGGWYDRLLPLRADGVRVFAMVHDDELVAGPLPTEAHDEPVDAVITPEEWFLLEGSAFASER
ncbi:MAG: 5-formyltetrahydrofolate cyclo-ligase [Actinomyces dentalis]